MITTSVLRHLANRIILFIILGAILLSSTPSYAAEQYREPGSDSQRTEYYNKRLVYNYFWSLNSRQLDRLDRIVAEDYVSNAQGVPSGREQLKEYFAGLFTAAPDLHLTIQRSIGVMAEGDLVAVRNRIAGTQNGKSFDIGAINIWRVENGKLAEHWELSDQLSLLTYLGDIPEEAFGPPLQDTEGTRSTWRQKIVNGDEQANKELVRRLYEEAIESGDPEDFVPLVAEDYIQNNGVSESGLAALQQFFAAYRTAFPDGSNEIQQIVADKNLVLVRVRVTGTHRAELFGIPPTGEFVDYETIDIFRIEDGKIAEHWDVVDRLLFFQQLGVLAE